MFPAWISVVDIRKIPICMCDGCRRGFTNRLKRLKPRGPRFRGPQNFESNDDVQHFWKHHIVMALGPLHTEINSISVSTKSKGTSSAESTYKTDVRWRRAAMRRKGLRAESKHITPRSAKARGAFLWSKGLGVGNWQTKTFLSLGIIVVRFPGLN